MSSPEHSPVAPRPARVARTYGRVAPVELPSACSASLPDPSLSRALDATSTRSTGRSKPAPGSGSASEGDIPLPITTGKYDDWRTRLQAMNSDSDDEDAPVKPNTKPMATSRAASRAVTPQVVVPQATSRQSAGRQRNAEHASSPSSSQREGASFDFSMEAALGALSPDTSPSTSPVELPVAADKPSRPSTSRRPPTHSTRDDDEPLKARDTSAAPKKKKGKPDAAPDQPAKPKRLTKKEQAEMARETARMLSDQRVSLSRGTRNTRLSLSDLTEKLSSKCRPQRGVAPTGLQPAHGAPSSPIDMFSSSSAIEELAAAAAPSFSRDPKRPVVKPKDLGAMLLKRGRAQAAKVRQEKEEDWVRRGGVLKRPQDEMENKDSQATLTAGVEDEEARDPDWEPDTAQGDADVESGGSDSEHDDAPGIGSGDEDATEDMDDAGPAPTLLEHGVDVEDLGGDTEEDENAPPKLKAKPLVKRRTAGVIADSDSENEVAREQILVAGTSFVIPRGPTSSSASESEKDKENSEFRKFDGGDDKENRAAPPLFASRRHPSVSPSLSLRRRRSRSVLSDDEIENKENSLRTLTSQRPPLSTVARLERRYTFDGSEPRAVLGVLAAEERPTLAELSLDSPQRPGDVSPLQMKQRAPRPLDDDDLGGGFTQLFEQDEAPRGRPALPRSLSEHVPRRLFEGFKPSASQQSLQFTPTQNRRSALKITESQRIRDDDIMAMDMEDMPSQSPTKQDSEWFIGDNGLMTQTRPTFTPIQPTPTLAAPFESRLGPSPLEREDMPTPASEHVMRRLKRKSEPLSQNDFFSPTKHAAEPPAKRQRSAFDVLQEGAVKAKKKSASDGKAKKLPSEYVQDQADESDDETGLGFGGVKDGDDDIDEEALKAAVEGMMDDQQMDVDTLAEDLILEKHKEHLEADDLKLQELHEKAARGDLRQKKGRGGLNLDDDSSDEEGFKRPRPAKHARNVENDSLPELAKNPKTKAFYEVYQSATVDDDMFVLTEMELGSDEEDERKAEGGDGEGDDDQEEAPRVVSAKEIRQAILSAAKKPAVAIDPEDVDWVTAEFDDNDDMDLQVEEVPRKAIGGEQPRAAAEPFDRDLVLKRPTTGSSAKLQTWAKQEGANKSFSSRRGGATSAVTGHAGPSRASSTNVVERRKVKPGALGQRAAGGLGKFLEKKR